MLNSLPVDYVSLGIATRTYYVLLPNLWFFIVVDSIGSEPRISNMWDQIFVSIIQESIFCHSSQIEQRAPLSPPSALAGSQISFVPTTEQSRRDRPTIALYCIEKQVAIRVAGTK